MRLFILSLAFKYGFSPQDDVSRKLIKIQEKVESDNKVQTLPFDLFAYVTK